MADSPNYYDNIPNAEPEHSLLNSFLDDYFQHKNFKNKTQRNAIVKILKSKYLQYIYIYFNTKYKTFLPLDFNNIL